MKEAIEYLKYKEIVKIRKSMHIWKREMQILDSLDLQTIRRRIACSSSSGSIERFDIQNMKWNLSKLQGICMISGMPLTERTMQSTGHFSQRSAKGYRYVFWKTGLLR